MKTIREEQREVEQLIKEKNTAPTKIFEKQGSRAANYKVSIEEVKKLEKLIDLKMALELVLMSQKTLIKSGRFENFKENEIKLDCCINNLDSYVDKVQLGDVRTGKYAKETTLIATNRISAIKERLEMDLGKKPTIEDIEAKIQTRIKQRNSKRASELTGRISALVTTFSHLKTAQKTTRQDMRLETLQNITIRKAI